MKIEQHLQPFLIKIPKDYGNVLNNSNEIKIDVINSLPFSHLSLENINISRSSYKRLSINNNEHLSNHFGPPTFLIFFPSFFLSQNWCISYGMSSYIKTCLKCWNMNIDMNLLLLLCLCYISTCIIFFQFPLPVEKKKTVTFHSRHRLFVTVTRCFFCAFASTFHFHFVSLHLCPMLNLPASFSWAAALCIIYFQFYFRYELIRKCNFRLVLNAAQYFFCFSTEQPLLVVVQLSLDFFWYLKKHTHNKSNIKKNECKTAQSLQNEEQTLTSLEAVLPLQWQEGENTNNNKLGVNQ